MANIAITNYCNLQCPYCFANDFVQENKENITVEQLERILEFIGREPTHRIGIIGGEPTLHPQLKHILHLTQNFARQHDNIPIVIFTNGINMDAFIKDIGPKLTVLVNLNEPEVIGESHWKKILENLERLKASGKIQHVNLGINLYPDIKDFEYILKVAKDMYKDSIRCSYVAPTCNYTHVNKDEYYLEAKEIFLKFLDKAEEYQIQLRLDCNHVPECYFTPEELERVNKLVDRWHTVCEPVVDITPDFRATACFGSYDPVDLSQFETLSEAISYFKEEKMYPLQEKNDGGKCKECEKFQDKTCQGGCLAFARYKVEEN